MEENYRKVGNGMSKIKLWGMGSGAKNMINFLMGGDFEVLGVTACSEHMWYLLPDKKVYKKEKMVH